MLTGASSSPARAFRSLRKRFSGRSALLTENQIRPTEAMVSSTSSSTSARKVAWRIWPRCWALLAAVLASELAGAHAST